MRLSRTSCSARRSLSSYWGQSGKGLCFAFLPPNSARSDMKFLLCLRTTLLVLDESCRVAERLDVVTIFFRLLVSHFFFCLFEIGSFPVRTILGNGRFELADLFCGSFEFQIGDAINIHE